MAGAEPGPIVAMEVLVEQNEIAPVRILLEFPGSSINRTPSLSVAQKDAGQAPAQFLSNLIEGHLLPRTGGTFNFEIIPVKGVIVQQCPDNEAIDGNPDGSTPVGVAAE